MVLKAGAGHLRARHVSSEDVVAAHELEEIAEQPFTSVCGALLYEVGACLPLHLDDIAACNANPFDPRDVL
eukprot:2497462-Prymnesium_polylepis.1